MQSPGSRRPDKTPSPPPATLRPSSPLQASANTPQFAPHLPPARASPSSAASRAVDTVLPAHNSPHFPVAARSVPSLRHLPARSSTPGATAPLQMQEYFPVPPSLRPAVSALCPPRLPSSLRAR